MIIPPIRKHDKYGWGHYGAARHDRTHKGVDYACYPESTILSDFDGHVTRIGYPYPPTGNKSYLRLIELSIDAQTRAKYMYIYPIVEIGQHVKKGDILGKCQDLSIVYPEITNHYHFEILIEGVNVDPIVYLNNKDMP